MTRIRYNDFFNELVSCLYWQSTNGDDFVPFEQVANRFGVKYERGFLAAAQRELKSKGLAQGPDPVGGDQTAIGRLTGEGLRFAEDKGLDDLIEDQSGPDMGDHSPEVIESPLFHSDSWTGRNFTSNDYDELGRNIDTAINRIESLSLDNKHKAQCRAFLVAAKELAGAPEPPLNVIQFLLRNVDRIIGIAGFMVGVAGLMVSLGI